MNKKISFLLLTLFLSTLSTSAKIKLPAIFSDNMVLQQQTNSKVWGVATANKTVKITTSWNNKGYSTKSDENGRFAIEITTPSAGGPYNITVSDGEVLTLKDVLIGEVWFCSGQSNMEMPVKGFRGQPVDNSFPYIFNADESRQLRLFTVKRAWSVEPKDNVEGIWSKTSSKEVADFSATAYFFGNLLQNKLKIPVGLIHCSWSASKIEAWMSKESLSQFSEVDLSVLNEKGFKQPNVTATLLHNGMVEPLSGIAVKGVLWYQGESNSANPAMYKKLFPALVNQWRSFFNAPELPFYYVQLAPYQSSNKDGVELPLFRQCQLEFMSEIPNVGMAITADAGSEQFIHPPYKIKVGERLAYWALAKTYGMDGFAYSGPIYKSYTVKDKIVELMFDHGSDGLNPEKVLVEGFEIAGGDGKFLPAKAEILGGSARVKVWHDDIANPSEVRYCFRNYMIGNLTNNAGMPATPFRVEIK